MSISIPIISSSGARSVKTLPDPVVTTSGYPLFATLTDDFTTRDDTKWLFAAGADVANGQANLPLPVSQSGFHDGASLTGRAFRSLKNSHALFKVAEFPAPGTHWLAAYYCVGAPAPYNTSFVAQWTWNGTQIGCQVYNDTNALILNTSFNFFAATHIWYHIGIENNILIFRTSADGTTWTVQASVDVTTGCTGAQCCRPYVRGQTWSAIAAPGRLSIDNFNLPNALPGPPPPPGPPPTLPALWNASPPAGVSPAPVGEWIGAYGDFDQGPLAVNELWDNFDGPAGSNPDSRLWDRDTINQGGTQIYQPSSSFLDGNGNIVLEATQPGGLGTAIYSGRFTSRGKFNMEYGWLACRAKLPLQQGIHGRSWWPCIWTLHVGINGNKMPYSELDFMEQFGDGTKYATHAYFPGGNLESLKDVPTAWDGGNAGLSFHTYWLLWEPDHLLLGVDDLVMGDWRPADLAQAHPGPLDPSVWSHNEPHYWIFFFAAAPPWLGAPVAGDFAAPYNRMLIDWVWFKPLALL